MICMRGRVSLGLQGLRRRVSYGNRGLGMRRRRVRVRVVLVVPRLLSIHLVGLSMGGRVMDGRGVVVVHRGALESALCVCTTDHGGEGAAVEAPSDGAVVAGEHACPVGLAVVDVAPVADTKRAWPKTCPAHACRASRHLLHPRRFEHPGRTGWGRHSLVLSAHCCVLRRVGIFGEG